MGPKIYTVKEANSLIPQLEAIFEELDTVRADLKRLKTKADILEMLWGEEVSDEKNPDYKEYIHYTNEMEKAKARFDETNKKFTELEGFLKGLETGLIDFYGVIDGRLAFLCWKRGEKEIDYWHHIDDGFAGRQPIPEELKV